MSQWNSLELAGYQSGRLTAAVVKPNQPNYGGGIRIFTATIQLANYVGGPILSGDTIVLAYVPTGFSFVRGWLVADSSMGTALISIGNALYPVKYRAAAPMTAVQVPQDFGPVTYVPGSGIAFQSAPLAVTETVLLSVAVANLPPSGNLMVQMLWAAP
jgi:hypothetical protein